MTEQTPTDTQQYLNVASQCAATATSELAKNVLVDDGSGTLRELLNDAADAIRAGWGSHVLAGEVESSLRFTGGFHVRLYRDAHMPEPGTKLYTTPQPTQPQAGAVPMTPEQRDALWESCKYDDGEEWTVDWEQIVDAVERHHRIGIKGGQPTQAAEPVAREPLTDEQIQDLLLCGNPTDEEMRLIRIGWDAAHGIKGGQHGTE